MGATKRFWVSVVNSCVGAFKRDLFWALVVSVDHIALIVQILQLFRCARSFVLRRKGVFLVVISRGNEAADDGVLAAASTTTPVAVHQTMRTFIHVFFGLLDGDLHVGEAPATDFDGALDLIDVTFLAVLLVSKGTATVVEG